MEQARNVINLLRFSWYNGVVMLNNCQAKITCTTYHLDPPICNTIYAGQESGNFCVSYIMVFLPGRSFPIQVNNDACFLGFLIAKRELTEVPLIAQ